MDTFSIGGAWSFGVRLLTQRLWLQLLVLIGLGIVIPLGLQFALLGQVIGMNGTLAGQTPPAAAGNPLTGILQLVGYFLQLLSYFTSWRLGFAPQQPLPGALVFGFLAALLATLVFALVGVPALVAIGASFASGIPFLGLLAGLIALLLVVPIFYTVPAAFLATFAAFVLVLSMLFGAVTGNVGLAATLIGGGSGAVVVLFLVLSVVMLWIATRLSCTTSLMADWKSYNLLAAIRESWRLTLEDQWPILRYLLLVAFAMAVFIGLVSLAAGAGAAALLQGRNLGGSLAGAGPIAGLALGAIFGIPFALLSVFVPAGIYRDLTRSALAAEVFA
jgi:hypothetical protein